MQPHMRHRQRESNVKDEKSTHKQRTHSLEEKKEECILECDKELHHDSILFTRTTRSHCSHFEMWFYVLAARIHSVCVSFFLCRCTKRARTSDCLAPYT